MSADIGTPSGFPTPPRFLIERVAQPSDDTDEQMAAGFVATGHWSVDELDRTLTAAGCSLSDVARVLDWGCGPGRVVLRLLERHPHLDVYGIDTDRASVDWLQEHAPAGVFVAVDPEPPTPFDDESFDLVINHSVLTHLDAPAQRAWLAEIARILQPDGWFVTSVHGAHTFADQLQHVDDSVRRTWIAGWGADRFVFEAVDGFIGTGHHDGYHTTFQDPTTIEQLSDYVLEPRVIIYQGDLGYQDQVALRKRSPAERERRRSLEPELARPVSSVAATDDTRLAHVERAQYVTKDAVDRLGVRVARLEDRLHMNEHRTLASRVPAPVRAATRPLRRWLASRRPTPLSTSDSG